MLGPLAQHEGAPLQRQGVDARRCRRYEDLLDLGHGPKGDAAEALGLGGHHPPSQDAQSLLSRGLLHHGTCLGGVVTVGGQEGQPDGVATAVGEPDPRGRGRLRQEGVRDLHENARAVAGVHLRPRRAAVGQALEDGQPAVDDVVAGTSLEIGHHADPAGVVLVCRVVEASGHRRPSVGEK